MKIVGIGETVLDIIFRNRQPIAAVPGGSTFNSIISLGRTVGRLFPDIPVMMVSEVGDDRVGDITTEFMRQNNVSCGALARKPGTQTGISLAFLDSNNNADYEFYRDSRGASGPASSHDMTFSAGDIVVFGSFFAINPHTRNLVQSLLSEADNAGAVLYYDINFRRNHIDELPAAMSVIEENCRRSTFVRASGDDLMNLFGSSDPQEAYERYISSLCPNLICTYGANPTHVMTPGAHLVFDAPQFETVSTIGAGDSFNAGFIFGLLSQHAAPCGHGTVPAEKWPALVECAGKFSENVCRSIFNYVDTDFADRLL